MKKFILISIILLITNMCLASNPWIVIYESSEKATTPAAVDILRSRNMYYYQKEVHDFAAIIKAEITNTVFEYKGATTCPIGSSRLLHTKTIFSYCNADDSCGYNGAQDPSPKDPCAN